MLSVVLSSAKVIPLANDANVSIFSPDKSEKLLKGLTIFVKKKRTAEVLLPTKRPH
jgi:hypothetical protein